MDISYYPGCSLDGTAKEYGESLKAIAKTLEIEFHELQDWNCCGSSSAHVTNDELALALAARNLAIADRAGMDLVVPCAACYQRLKPAAKKLALGKRPEGMTGRYGGNFRIKHAADFLWEDMGEKALSQKVKTPLKGLKVACYYGCLTARPPKVTDARNPENPMAMDHLMECLGAIVKPWSYKTDCCGGDLIPHRPDIAKKLILGLLDMAKEARRDV